MKKYKEYKDSGVKWIGIIPSHWKSRFLSQIASEQNLSNKGMINGNLLSLSYGRIIRKSMDSANGLLPASFETYQVINNGNIILRFTDLQNDHKSLRVGLVKEEGIITSAYTCITPKKSVISEYLYFLLHSADIKKVFYGMGGGLRQNLNYAEFRKLRLMIPPLPEQNEIVAYLDKKISKIDKYISTAEKKIAALDELKQVTIADAVTHGINPNVSMKDSGIPWIGMVPEHWKLTRIKFLFNEISEKEHPEEPCLCSTQKYGVIPQSMYENRVVVVNKGLENLKFVRKGNFVISLRSFQGGIEIAYYQGIISAAYTILSLGNKNISSNYIKYLFKSSPFIQLLQTCVTGIREGQNINYELLRRQFIPIPTLSQQNEIVAYIDRKVAQIDKMKAAELAQIEKLKEYKQRLISDVVTGKVKVTNE